MPPSHQRPIKCVGLILLAMSLGCGRQLPPEDESLQKTVLSQLASAKMVEVWEGLPHPHREPQAFEDEQKRMKTIDLHGHQFYDDARELTPAQQQQFVDLLTQRSSLSYQGPGVSKTCGGFHPDLALRFKDGDDQYSILFCFGCQDIEFIGPSHSTKFNMDAAPQFEALWQPLKNQRSEHKPPS